MKLNNIKEKLTEMYVLHFNEDVLKFQALPQSGSNRKYYRLSGLQNSAIGVYNPFLEENKAFISLSRHFHTKGLTVPEIYSSEDVFYLQQDIGDVCLFDLVSKRSVSEEFSAELVLAYKQVIKDLIVFQLKGREGFSEAFCFQNCRFDEAQVLRDLNYFKYYFLKVNDVDFNEFKLDEEFSCLSSEIGEMDSDYFMYRDFQTRNIHVFQKKFYYIDYQGGTKGPLQYDLASLLFQAKARIPDAVREELLDFYLCTLGKEISFNKKVFKNEFYLIALIRTLQVLGAYGFRGIVENKAHFLTSIPYALDNLSVLIGRISTETYPELTRVVKKAIALREEYVFSSSEYECLTVSVNSFSYRKKMPSDLSGNGGGFVFDCRALPNPGRLQDYQSFTGMDDCVIDFFESKSEIHQFLEHVFQLIGQSVQTYHSKKFTHLEVSFGCTGGQHRSVYCAEQLVKHLTKHSNLRIVLNHREQGIVKTIACNKINEKV